MATKYNRVSETSDAIEERRTPWMRQGPPQRRLTGRQRLVILFMGLIAIGLLGQLAYRLNREANYFYQPVVRGEGLIVMRDPDDGGAGTIALEIDTGVQKYTASAHIPAPYWAELTEGDRVAVLYRTGKMGDALELLECGLVALPRRNR